MSESVVYAAAQLPVSRPAYFTGADNSGNRAHRYQTSKETLSQAWWDGDHVGSSATEISVLNAKHAVLLCENVMVCLEN